MALGLSFVLVVLVSCIFSVCLSVCVCLLCGGRIKIVNVTEMGRDGDRMGGYGMTHVPVY